MPTLIGRFNELLHNLSSSTSSSSSSNPTIQHQSRHPPTRSSSYRVSSSNFSSVTSSANRNGRQHQQQQVHQVKSSNQSRHRRIESSSSSSTRTRSNGLTKDGHQQHERSQQRRRQYRSGTSSVANSHCYHLNNHRHRSTSKNRETPNSNRNSSNNNSSSQHSSQQTRHRQRRHSIASVSSVTNNKFISSIMATAKNNGTVRTPIAIMENNNNVKHNNSQPNEVKVSSSVMKWNNSKDNVDNMVSKNANNSMDESLASMLVRKMKIGAITRKASHSLYHCPNQTQIFHKKISKISKKDVESTDGDDESKGTFINRYLDGQLTKQHPDIISGKTCYDMPIKDIELLETKVVAACTGPNGGLLTVNNTAASRPFELADDVDFIDEDYPDSSLSSNGCDTSPQNSAKLSTSSVSSDTGEIVTYSDVESSSNTISNNNNINKKNVDRCEPVAGIDNWNRSDDFAYGISTTLYESHPSTKQKAGDPIADSYGICVRENSAILALADGVNWGEKACLASRCAVHGCIDYLNKALYSTGESTRSRNTMDIFVALLRSFNAAHNMILSQGGHLTTLCAAVICQLKDSDRFIVCTCNVGDSLAYVYSPSHGVREITQGSHDIFSMRDMRDALGALGPVSGSEPELNNLTVAMTIVDVGDIVFLTSDGISDNFDPVVGKFAIPKKEQKNSEASNGDKVDAINETSTNAVKPKPIKNRKIVQRSNSNPEKSSARHLNYTSKGLPLVSAQQRHELTLLRMEDLIMNGVNGIEMGNNGPYGQSSKKTAKELCYLMVDFSTKLTMAKRRILEDPDLYSDDEDFSTGEAFDKQRQRRRMVGQKLAQVPGKLDHASIAAVEIGFYGSLRSKKAYIYNDKSVCQPTRPFGTKHSLEARYNLKMKATLARFESQDSLESINEAGPI